MGRWWVFFGIAPNSQTNPEPSLTQQTAFDKNWYTSRNDDYPKRVGAKLSGHFRFGQAALQHRDRGQEIVASGSQISGKDRVRAIGKIGDTHPLLLVLDVGLEKLNAPTQISGERLQFHGGAGMVQYCF
jgi:hypothetical protein